MFHWSREARFVWKTQVYMTMDAKHEPRWTVPYLYSSQPNQNTNIKYE